jgi:hypothetical protein
VRLLAFTVVAATILSALGPATEVAAQTPRKPTTSDGGLRFGEARTETWQFGVVVTAGAKPCAGVLAALPVPTDWPEQAVTIVKEEKTSHVKGLEYKLLGGGVKQMRVTIPSLAAGAEAKAVLTVQIRRQAILVPSEPESLSLPAKLPANLKDALLPSPYVESGDAKIQALAKEIVSGKEGDWQRAEAICNWVRTNVEYKNGPLKGARQALTDRSGDCEELTALFVALCRANKVPARTVWVPGHCYGEFYLADKSGRGHWLPCQAAGNEPFGSMEEFRPILQKGDNFRVPELSREPQHYVTEFIRAKGGQPAVKFIRQKVTDGPTGQAN